MLVDPSLDNDYNSKVSAPGQFVSYTQKRWPTRLGARPGAEPAASKEPTEVASLSSGVSEGGGGGRGGRFESPPLGGLPPVGGGVGNCPWIRGVSRRKRLQKVFTMLVSRMIRVIS